MPCGYQSRFTASQEVIVVACSEMRKAGVAVVEGAAVHHFVILVFALRKLTKHKVTCNSDI